MDRRTVVYAAPLLVFDFGLASGLGKVDDNAGFAFNAYCAQASGQDAVIPFLQGRPCTYSAGLSFENAEAQSRRTGAALFMSEFGGGNDLNLSKTYMDAADDAMVGWTYWAYCGCGDPTGDDATQGIVNDPAAPLTGANVQAAKLKLYSRPHPSAVAGTPRAWRFAAATKTFTLSYTPRRAGGGRAFGPGSATEISAPPIQYPSGYGVRVRGARVTSKPGAPTVRLELCRGATRVTATIRPGTTRAAARRCG